MQTPIGTDNALVIGQRCRAEAINEPFEDDKGCLVEFEPRTILIEILPKPEHVMEDDGLRPRRVPLPAHLAGPEWFAAINLTTRRKLFVHRGVYRFSPLGQ